MATKKNTLVQGHTAADEFGNNYYHNHYHYHRDDY